MKIFSFHVYKRSILNEICKYYGTKIRPNEKWVTDLRSKILLGKILFCRKKILQSNLDITKLWGLIKSVPTTMLLYKNDSRTPSMSLSHIDLYDCILNKVNKTLFL